ncbi:MAG: polyprenyl synthetase family protein, partial [Acidimicrobiia bacterium]|nr:polyprenyl synthetase family protein [Acidimicrobiia bacterium]
MASPVAVAPLPPLAEGLERVHAALFDAVRADDPGLSEMATHLIRDGGKRQRPAFTMAAAMTASTVAASPLEQAVLGGVSVELVHLGSLYHDDVMDEATTRHFVESVNARWGNLQAILAGDYLLAKASEIAAGIGTEVAGLLAATIGRLCEGQLTELADAFNATRTEERYFRSIAGKTAALFSTACRIGGLVAGLPRDRVDALTTFGLEYGMAFQVVDDILDVVATDEELGKPAGHDILEGTYTLPVILVLAAPGGDELRTMLGRPLQAEELQRARDIVRANGSLARAVATAHEHADRAVAALGDAAGTESGAWLA